MRVAITFRHQAEHERRGDEQGYSSLGWREAKSLPHVIESETPALFSHEVTSASSRNCRASFPNCSSRNRQGCLFRTERRDACITIQTARRKVPASNENLLRQCDQFLLHLVLFLLPRPNQNRTIMFPDVGIVE